MATFTFADHEYRFYLFFTFTGDNTSTNDDATALMKNLTASASFHHSSNLTQQLKSASFTASLNAIAAVAAANSQAPKFKGKRKFVSGMNSNSTNAIDKMLSDRLNLADSKKFCDINNSKSIAHNNTTSNEKGKF